MAVKTQHSVWLGLSYFAKKNGQTHVGWEWTQNTDVFAAKYDSKMYWIRDLIQINGKQNVFYLLKKPPK